ncbi:hypothetical protein FB107DRAFT_252787, partial [Schizophyllum commune]
MARDDKDKVQRKVLQEGRLQVAPTAYKSYGGRLRAVVFVGVAHQCRRQSRTAREMRKQPRPLQYRKLEPRTINAAEAVTLPAQSSDIESAPTTPKSSDPIENWQSLSQHMARSRDPLRPLGDGEAEEEEEEEEEERISSAGVPEAYRALLKGRKPPATQRTVAQMKVAIAAGRTPTQSDDGSLLQAEQREARARRKGKKRAVTPVCRVSCAGTDIASHAERGAEGTEESVVSAKRKRSSVPTRPPQQRTRRLPRRLPYPLPCARRKGSGRLLAESCILGRFMKAEEAMVLSVGLAAQGKRRFKIMALETSRKRRTSLPARGAMPKKAATAVRATSGSAVSPYALRTALERVQRASGRDLHAQPSSPARSVRDGRSSGSPASPKAASRSPRQESSSEGDVPEPMDVERPVEPTEPPRTLAAGGSAALSETQAPAGDVSGSVGDGVEIGTEALSLPELGGGLSLDDPTQPSRTQMDISAAK